MFGSVRCSSSELHSFSLTSLVRFEDLAASVDSSAVSFEAPSGCSWSLKMSQKQRGDGNISSSSPSHHVFQCDVILDDLGSNFRNLHLSPGSGAT